MTRYAEVEKTMFELEKAFDEEISIQRDTRFCAYANTLRVKAQSVLLKNAISETDVQEVKHGKWIFENGYITCSNCKCQPYKQSKTIDYYNLHNYCPNCGAKMDGKD